MEQAERRGARQAKAAESGGKDGWHHRRTPQGERLGARLVLALCPRHSGEVHDHRAMRAIRAAHRPGPVPLRPLGQLSRSNSVCSGWVSAAGQGFGCCRKASAVGRTRLPYRATERGGEATLQCQRENRENRENREKRRTFG